MTGQTPRGKVIQFDYDDLLATFGGRRCLALSERTIKMLAAQTDYYHWTARYKSDTGATIDRDTVEAWASQLERELMLDNECEPEPCEDGCTDFLPSAPLIDYAPMNPFQNPAFVPAGYLLPPFYTNVASGVTGVVETDVLVNFAAIPVFAQLPDLLASGFPRARISFEGMGQIEIEFISLPQGGFAMITLDDNPLTAKFVNLASVTIGDIASLSELLELTLEGGIVQSTIFERDVDSSGLHHMDITFLPNVGEGVVVGFGGGIRRVSLCGISTRAEEMNDCCPEIVGRRINELGQIETTTDGVIWGVDDTEDPRKTSVKFPNYQGFEGDVGRCAAAENVTAEIQNQVGIILDQIAGGAGIFALTDALVLAGAVIFSGGLLAPLVLALVVAAIGFGHEALEAAMTSDVYDRFKCNLFCRVSEDGSFSDAQVAEIHTQIDVDEAGIANVILHKFVDLYGAVGLSNIAQLGTGAGDSCGDCDECNECIATATNAQFQWQNVSPDWTPEGWSVSGGTLQTNSLDFGVGQATDTLVFTHDDGDVKFCAFDIFNSITTSPAAGAYVVLTIDGVDYPAPTAGGGHIALPSEVTTDTFTLSVTGNPTRFANLHWIKIWTNPV